MKQRFHGGLAVAAVLATTGACAFDDPAPGFTVTQALITPTGGPCARFICGANSPVIDVLEFHDFSLNPRERNAQGFELELANGEPQLVQKGVSWVLDVKDGRISGTLPGQGTVVGQDLVGATIPVRRGRARYELVIRTVREMTYFVAPFDPIEAYTLEWREVGRDGPTPNLCNNHEELEHQLETDPEGARRELMGMEVTESVVFEGDRVDAEAKTMDPAADDRWFNIGCAGHTLSKLRLTHNTVHAQAPGLPRAWEERQATLKLLVADYCNTGTSFTVAGQPLSWQGGGVVYWQWPKTLEARWTERGAACLDAPRMLTPTPLGAKMFPDIWDSIHHECKPDPCDSPKLDDLDGKDRISGNP